jgi:SAM-dependent methyltransferase
MQKREVLEARRDVVVPDPHNGGLSLKIHANFSKNTIEAETLERRINWVFGHWDHARFWESKLSPDRITAETLHTWRAGELDSWMTEPCEHVMLTPARGHARILNAGSGPLIRSAPLRCGDTFAHITNCDHSSRYYRLLAARYGYEDVPLPEHCNFEDLRLFYPLQYFDLVHVRNALDHCVSPELAVVGLVDILRSGGVAVLHHFENVHPGKWTSLESGLHQWGVTLRGDSSGTTSDSRDSPHLIIENLHVSHDITEMLRSSAEVTARREGHFIIAIIKRL